MSEEDETYVCGCDKVREFGPCPFAEEIHNDSTPCMCCDDCRHECCMDI